VQLDRLQAVLRPRNSFEAIDLGFAMIRRWWKPVYIAWIVTVLPCFVLVWAALHRIPYLAFFVLWWLKPIWERVPLFVLSRALFGDTPDLKTVLKALPKLWTGTLPTSLLLYRLDPMRSFYNPVLLLEGIFGSARRRRRAALLRTMGAAASWLTFACLSLEIVVAAGLFAFVVSLLPDTPDYMLDRVLVQLWDGTAPFWLIATFPFISFFAMSLTVPLYVGGGFALYLTRRTRLEGWDIELVFRGIATRLGKTAVSATKIAVIILFGAALTGGLLSAPRSAWAQDGSSSHDAQVSSRPSVAEGVDDGRPEKAIAEVLDRPEFPHPQKAHEWRLRNPREQRDGSSNVRLPSFLEPLGRILAMGLEGLMWLVVGVGVAGLLIVIISRLRKLERGDRKSKREPLPGPKVGRELLGDEPLPPDVAGAAWKLWEQGRHDEALGLLYRGALVHFVESGGLGIEDAATEGECLRIVRRDAAEPVAGFFGLLTRAWLEVAYAHRLIDGERFRELCTAWPSHFGGGP